MRNHLILTIVVPVVLLLAACGGGSASTEPTPTPTEATSSAAAEDVTGQVKAQAGDNADNVTAATVTEPGRVAVETDLVDPRTDNSEEGQAAVAICEAARSAGDYTYVSVTEADGTTFALYGHPSYSKDACSEV